MRVVPPATSTAASSQVAPVPRATASRPGARQQGFDHARTAWPLTSRHMQVTCDRCHTARKPDPATPGASTGCSGPWPAGSARAATRTCTRRGSAGTAAPATPPPAGSRRRPRASTTQRTGYPLRGRHAAVACDTCHGAGPADAPEARALQRLPPRRAPGELAQRAERALRELPRRAGLPSRALRPTSTRRPPSPARCAPRRGLRRVPPPRGGGAACALVGRGVRSLAATRCGECHRDPHRGETAAVAAPKALRDLPPRRGLEQRRLRSRDRHAIHCPDDTLRSPAAAATPAPRARRRRGSAFKGAAASAPRATATARRAVRDGRGRPHRLRALPRDGLAAGRPVLARPRLSLCARRRARSARVRHVPQARVSDGERVVRYKPLPRRLRRLPRRAQERRRRRFAMRKPLLGSGPCVALLPAPRDPRAEPARAAPRQARQGLRRLPQPRALDAGHQAVEVPARGDGLPAGGRARPGLVPRLPPLARVRPCRDRVRRLPQGRAPWRARLALRVVPPADQLDQPDADAAGAQPHAAAAVRHPRAARLHRLPPQPAALPVRGDACRVRQLPRHDLPRHDQPEPRRRRLLAPLRGLPQRDGRRPGRARPSRTRPVPAAGAHSGLACARCHGGGRPTRSGRRASPATSRPSRGGEPEPHRRRLPAHVRGLPHDRVVAAGEVRPREDGFPLTGAHTRTECARCHVGGRYKGTPSECNSCHQPDYARTTNPNHQAGGFSTRCQDCHNTGAWRPANFDHNKTRFRAHGRARADRVRALPRRRALHRHPDRVQLVPPARLRAHHQPQPPGGRLPDDLRELPHHERLAAGQPRPQQDALPAHGSAHARRLRELPRGRPLHRHADGLQLLPPAGLRAHHEPEPPGERLPDDVRELPQHERLAPARTSTTAKTRFPLTGAHTGVACATCHPGGRYTGTPTACSSCHQADYARTTNPNHQAAGFPTNCESCHTTSAWRPASFDHDGRYFPIYSGKHRGKWSSCSDCHVSPSNFKAFECVLCHEHSNRTEVDSKHRGVSRLRVPERRVLPLPLARHGWLCRSQAEMRAKTMCDRAQDAGGGRRAAPLAAVGARDGRERTRPRRGVRGPPGTLRTSSRATGCGSVSPPRPWASSRWSAFQKGFAVCRIVSVKRPILTGDHVTP